MKLKKKTFITILIGICMVIPYSLAHIRVDSYRSDYTFKLHTAVFPVPMELLNAMAGEFKGLLADYLLLEAASYTGSRSSFRARPEDWDAVAKLMMQSNALDPYFRSTYFLSQGILAWRGHKYDETLAILERSKNHLTWDWIPGFFMGFDYFFFLKDNLTASEKLMEASKVPGAPVTLATMAARLASEAGQYRAAIDFLTAMHENTTDEEAKKELAMRISALHGIKVLQEAISKFQLKFARMPNDLNELVTSSILPRLPENPYNRSYTMKDGKVHY